VGLLGQRVGIDVELPKGRAFPALKLELEMELAEVSAVLASRSAGTPCLGLHVHPHVGRVRQYLATRFHQPSRIPEESPQAGQRLRESYSVHHHQDGIERLGLQIHPGGQPCITDAALPKNVEETG